jgi:hypothetical protein
MTPELRPLRNVLVTVGAYYVSAWIVVPFWFPIAKLNEGHVYSGGLQELGMRLFEFLPVGATAVLAGVATGLLFESERPFRWAIFAGVFVGLMAWSSTRWFVKPLVSDLAIQGIRAFAAGAIAFAACRLAARRRGSAASPGTG